MHIAREYRQWSGCLEGVGIPIYLGIGSNNTLKTEGSFVTIHFEGQGSMTNEILPKWVGEPYDLFEARSLLAGTKSLYSWHSIHCSVGNQRGSTP
jgi:hypothetical protein